MGRRAGATVRGAMSAARRHALDVGPAGLLAGLPAGLLMAGVLAGVLVGVLVGVLMAVGGAGPANAGAAPKPQRIVSLNLCADELVLRLADPDKVASVTFLARDPGSSNVADLAARVPVNRGLAEEVVPLAPDLVLTGAFTTRTTTALLKHLGLRVVELGVPQTLDEAYGQIRTVAAALGEPERGQAMIDAIAAGIAALPPKPAVPPRAVVMRPNGFTAASGSLVDELMGRAGIDNLAGHLSTDKLGQLGLEEILVAQPDLLVVDTDPHAPASLAEDLLRHPAMAHVAAQGKTLVLPARLWACAGPELAEAARRLAAVNGAAAKTSSAAPLAPPVVP